MEIKMKKAIYSGSFDPITNGHLWAIKEASQIFDEVYVILANNSEKKSYFSTEEKIKSIKESITGISNVKVQVISHQFLADFAKDNNIKFMIRGIRDQKDFEYEKNIQVINQEINPDLKTVYLVPPNTLNHISSSLVKSLISYPNWQKLVKKLVPPTVVSQFIIKNNPKVTDDWICSSGVWFEKMISLYSEPHRYYHNLQHISELLNKAKNLVKIYNLSVSEANCLMTAIWFHDAVYNPMSKTNEDDSIKLLNDFVDDVNLLNLDELKIVSEMIAATKNHLNHPRGNKLIDLFLDLDLSILGASSVRFNEYCDQIRQEYIFVDDKTYSVERKKILNHFLTYQSLFRTEWGKKLSDSANQNLTKELEKL